MCRRQKGKGKRWKSKRHPAEITVCEGPDVGEITVPLGTWHKWRRGLGAWRGVKLRLGRECQGGSHGKAMERRAIIRLAHATHPSMSYLAPPAQLPELLPTPRLSSNLPRCGNVWISSNKLPWVLTSACGKILKQLTWGREESPGTRWETGQLFLTLGPPASSPAAPFQCPPSSDCSNSACVARSGWGHSNEHTDILVCKNR